MKDKKKLILKDVKKKCNNIDVIKRIKKSNDFCEIAFILFDARLDSIVDSHFKAEEREYYFEKWLQQRKNIF